MRAIAAIQKLQWWQALGDCKFKNFTAVSSTCHLTIGPERWKINGESLVGERTVKPLLDGTCTEQWEILSRRCRIKSGEKKLMNGKCITREFRTAHLVWLQILPFTLYMHFKCIFNVKGRDLQIVVFSFWIHSYSCITLGWWPEFRVETSCHVIKLLVRCVLVVTENTDGC